MATPEEQALQEYMRATQLQSDPFARSTNDYGQGAGFLGLDEQPESWDRVGEKNDVYSDLFRTTQTYLSDFIPDLNPEVQDPGQFQGYVSDKADLYRNNPAYAQLEQFMAEGASFDEAVQLTSKLAATRPEVAAGLPQYEGRPDAQAFRNSAETYVSERAREGREYDQYAAQKAGYDDFVNPQSDWSRSGGVEDITQFLRKSAPTSRPVIPMQLPSGNGNMRPDMPEVNANEYSEFYGPNSPNVAPAAPAIPSTRPSNGNVFRSAIENSNRGINRAAAQSQGQDRASNDAYNRVLTESYNRMRAAKEAAKGPSKKQENNMKLVRAYNMLMYGE